MIDFTDKTFFVAGVANKKSVAYFIAKNLQKLGANLILSAQTGDHLERISTLFPEAHSFILDVENQDDLHKLKDNCLQACQKLDGFVHSIAFAQFSSNDFLATPREHFLQACQISAFSFVEMANQLRDILQPHASLVTISISNTKATSYGYLGPVKAMLNSITGYMAKNFSEFSQIRVNTIAAGPLKTSASAGIPDYLDNYLYSEALTLRKKALSTDEVAKTAIYLLSDLSSGLNGECLTLDAGINLNYFDQDIVKTYTSAKF